MSVFLLALGLAAAAQDPEALVARLGSDAVGERDAAERELIALGAAAAPALRRAVGSAEGEAALRIRFLLRILELGDSLPPALKAAIPGVEVRLARGRWREVLLEAADRKRHPGLRREDLEPLAPGAFEGPLLDEPLAELCRVVGWRRLRTAVPALARVSPPEEPLSDPAGDALVAIADADAVAAFAEKTAREDGLRFLRSWTLGGLDRGPALQGLRRALADPDGATRAHAALLLAELGSPEGATELVRALKSEDARRRLEAAAALASIGKRDGLGLLVETLADVRAGQPDRIRALTGIGMLRAPEAEVAVRTLLDSPDVLLREYGARALGPLEGEAAVAVLAGLLDDPTGQVRTGAVEGLDAVASPAAVPPLERALSDPNVFVRGPALRALARREGARRLPEILSFVTSRTSNDTVNAARCLAGIPGEAWKPVFRGWIREGKHLAKIADCLEVLEEPDPAPELLERFGGADDAVKEELARYFATVRFREAVPAVEAWFPRCPELSRPYVAESLCKLGSRLGAAAFLRRTEDSESESLTSLNPVRSPAACRDLHRIRVELPERIAPAVAWARVAEKLGVELQLPETASWQEEQALRQPVSHLDDDHVWATLEDLAIETRFETVVEDGRLRVLPRPLAMQFWKAWTAEAAK